VSGESPEVFRPTYAILSRTTEAYLWRLKRFSPPQESCFVVDRCLRQLNSVFQMNDLLL